MDNLKNYDEFEVYVKNSGGKYTVIDLYAGAAAQG